MNFKPNAWTLLFALSLGALLFNMYGSQETAPAPSVSEETVCPPNSITPQEAYDMKELYKAYLDTHKALMDSLKLGVDGVENPDVVYFQVPRCELREMVNNLNPNEQSDVLAYIGIKLDSSTGKNMLDLFFEEKNARVTNSTTGEVLASKGDGGGTMYWDFTQPCPPTCPKN